MNSTALAANDPQIGSGTSYEAPTRGELKNNSWLTVTSNGPYQSSALTYPRIPTLAGGPAAHGWCLPGYWNQTSVDILLTDSTLQYYVFTQSTPAKCVFDGYDQIVLKNGTAGALTNVGIRVGTAVGQKIVGASGADGVLPATPQ